MIAVLDFKIDIQLFSEERTEPATPKRRREAREKGQVLKSREAVTAFALLIGFWSLKLLAHYFYSDLSMMLTRFLNFGTDIEGQFQIENLMRLLVYCLILFAKVVGPILIISALVAVLINYLQVGFLFTLKPLQPDLKKLNPLEGFKRLFSRTAMVEFLKSILKISIIGFVVYDYLKKNYTVIPDLISMSLEGTAAFIGNTIINVGLRVAFVLLVLSIFDYVFQYFEFEKNIKMTKQEIKEEYKQTEGNPQIKAKIKEKQRQLSLRRMMTEVPKADVIITNPTHFAIAVKYDANVAEAPIVIAKGKDLIAQRIKQVAKEKGVPTVENRPLAQALYKSVEIGRTIPAELYKAVAEVLAFVYSLKNK